MPPMRNRSAVGVLVLLSLGFWAWLALPGCQPGGGAHPQTAGPPSTQPLHQALPVETYLERVNQLSAPEMQGRGLGTAGLERARHRLVQALRRLGLQPGHLDGQTATEADGYSQAFPVSMGRTVGSQRLNLRDVPARPGRDFETLGFSPNAVNFTGAPVFVGYGITAPEHHHDSYADLNDDGLAGKVAVAFRFEPMDGEGVSRWTQTEGRWSEHAALTRKAQLAAARGAVALLVVDPPSRWTGVLRTADETAFVQPPDARPIPAMHITPRLLLLMLGEAGLGEIVLPAYQQLADRSALRAEAWPGLALSGQAELRDENLTAHNVAARLPGRGVLANEAIVLVAHYDHLGFGGPGSGSRLPRLERITPQLHPGADDNASGVAALWLAGERLMQQSRWSRPEANEAPRRTILLLFTSAEERGRLGARAWLASYAAHRTLKPAAMINLDMVGRMRQGRLTVQGVDTSPVWREALQHANSRPGLRLSLGGSPWTLGDHRNFAEAGIPAVHLFTGLHPDFHLPSDTADLSNDHGEPKFNPAGGAAVGALAAELAWHLATMPGPIDFTEVDKAGAPAEPTRLGPRF